MRGLSSGFAPRGAPPPVADFARATARRVFATLGTGALLLGFASLTACREERPAPQPLGQAGKIPRQADVLAAAKATGAPVVAPAILEPTDDEPETPDAGAVEPVKLTLQISPVTADVFWGGKRLGVAKAGVPFAITRPRNSGPLELLVRAPGFLPYHTRLFTDRDDKLSIVLRRGNGARAGH